MLLFQYGPTELDGDRPARLRAGPVTDPLPELGSGDLRGGRVFHQVVDRDRARATEPGGQVMKGHADVPPYPRLSDPAPWHPNVQELGPFDLHVISLLCLLVRSGAEH